MGALLDLVHTEDQEHGLLFGSLLRAGCSVLDLGFFALTSTLALRWCRQHLRMVTRAELTLLLVQLESTAMCHHLGNHYTKQHFDASTGPLLWTRTTERPYAPVVIRLDQLIIWNPEYVAHQAQGINHIYVLGWNSFPSAYLAAPDARLLPLFDDAVRAALYRTLPAPLDTTAADDASVLRDTRQTKRARTDM